MPILFLTPIPDHTMAEEKMTSHLCRLGVQSLKLIIEMPLVSPVCAKNHVLEGQTPENGGLGIRVAGWRRGQEAGRTNPQTWKHVLQAGKSPCRVMKSGCWASWKLRTRKNFFWVLAKQQACAIPNKVLEEPLILATSQASFVLQKISRA